MGATGDPWTEIAMTTFVDCSSMCLPSQGRSVMATQWPIPEWGGTSKGDLWVITNVFPKSRVMI